MSIQRYTVVALIATGVWGCTDSAPPAVDATPFRDAIASYLETNQMALKIKEVKEGPTIDGDRAVLTTSLEHQELTGPAVTWKFEFERQEGQWIAVRHIR